MAVPLPSFPPGLIKQDWTDADIAVTTDPSDVNPHTAEHNKVAAVLNASYFPGVVAFHDFGVDPGLGYYTLTQPTGLEHATAATVSGRLRFTGDAAVTDVNHRFAAPSGKLGVMGDSEVFSEWHALDTPLISAGGLRQMGHSHRVTKTVGRRKVGIATSGSGTTISDSTAPFVSSEFIGKIGGENDYYVSITAGTGVGQTRRITANTTTQLTVDTTWTTSPDNTSYYKVWYRNTRALIWAWDIGFSGATRGIFNLYSFEGNSFAQLGAVDLRAYLFPGSVYQELPWGVKTQVVGRVAKIAVWAGTDPATEYGTAGRSGTVNLPNPTAVGGFSFDEAGESGLYVGHLDAGKWMEFENLLVRRI